MFIVLKRILEAALVRIQAVKVHIRTNLFKNQTLNGDRNFSISISNKLNLEMRISLLLHVFLCIIFYSCTSLTDKEKGSQNENYLKESITILLDSVSTYQFNWIQVETDNNNKEFLINLNKIYNSLDFYDLESKKLFKRIEIGKMSLGNKFFAHSFFYHNKDSIFIFPQFSFNGTLVINDIGEKIDERFKIDDFLEKNNESPYILNHITTPSNPSVYRNGNIYFSTIQMNVDIYNPLTIDVIPNYKWDLESNLITPILNVKYPNEYLEKIATSHHSFTLKTVKGDSLIYSYPLLDTVYIYNFNHELISKKYCGSPNFKGFIEVPAGNPFNEQFKFVISQNSYARLLYDKYREVYYRFFIIGRNLSEEDRSTKDNSKNKFSVLVYDSDFNLINQVEFPEKKYFHYSAFVGVKGLYIPLTNKDYEGLSDEYIKYDIFAF
ncbi:DUF4221 family protein [Algoriphagus sp. D3-2-R+10]|uniref:DUF4221 family protein n=1 Tax=Algoriphagus aurantiacus TaxID=3103948 RepID=UPI002B368A73|nr:DUF4221 family protein [Algoriphagus sp. D3-2-R+10]MEB2778133.1 DUF4221 family protein [Algoriphagus sp. D3-2-R+10]